MSLNKVTYLIRFVLVAALWMQSTPGFSASTEELQRLEKDIEASKQKSTAFKTKASSMKQEVSSLRAELIALSQSVQQREANVTRLELAIGDLIIEEKHARLVLEERHGQSIDTLIALQRLALNPPEALIALPQPPADMVRSAILLRSIVPQIQKQAQDLRIEVERYAQKRTKLEAQKKRLGNANQNLGGERRRLKVLIAEKKALSARYAQNSKAETKRVAKLIGKAKSLRGLLDKIEKDKKSQAAKKKRDQKKQKAKPKSKTVEQKQKEIVFAKPPMGSPIGKMKGELSRPASGRVVMRFGEKEKLGGKHRGVSIKTRRSAQIVATYDGQIAFAGPFRGYKQLLIIDHGDGYHTLLTGMKQIDVSVGQWLLSGEPVGVMSSNRSSDATLYFELRKNGAPINPLSWMRRQNAKARG